MGCAWDLKKVSPTVVEAKIASTGDPALGRYEKGHGLREQARGLTVMASIIIFFLVLHYLNNIGIRDNNNQQ